MKKTITVCLMTFLGFGISAQEDQFNNEFPENEDGREAVLMILDKESNVPVCRLSDQVKINSELIPENRIGDVGTTSTQDVRVCQEEDVWEAALDDEEIVIAIAAPNISSLMSSTVPIISFAAGSIVCDIFEGTENDNEHWDSFEEGAYFGLSIMVLLRVVTSYKELLPRIFGGSSAPAHMFFNPVIGTGVTALGVLACIL